MIKISPKQAQIRLRSLPEEIKKELFSEEGTELILSIGQKNHLSQEKSFDLDLLVGYILSGFVHYGNLEREIEAYIHVPHQSALDIGKEIRLGLLDKYKDVLESLYRPLDEKDFGLQIDRRQIPRPTPVKLAEPQSKTPFVTEINKPRPSPNIPKPQPPLTPPPATKPAVLKAEPKPSFSQIFKSNSTPLAPPSPSAGQPSKTTTPPPSPFILNSKPESKPIFTPKDFKVPSSIPSPQRMSIPIPPAVKPAKIELGQADTMGENKSPAPAVREIVREPIKYSVPKDIFPQSQPLPNLPSEHPDNIPSPPPTNPPIQRP